MSVAQINLQLAQETFPSIFIVFGSVLRGQIEEFNDIVQNEEYHADDFDIVIAILARSFPCPHDVILRTLSNYQAGGPFLLGKGWLQHLERCLRLSLEAGDNGALPEPIGEQALPRSPDVKLSRQETR